MITKLMIAIVVILFIMGTGCLILDQQDKNRKLEKQNKELQTTVDLLKAGQEAMQNDQKQYARLYHDYKNHAICMQRLIEQKKYKDLEVYLKGMQENYFYGRSQKRRICQHPCGKQNHGFCAGYQSQSENNQRRIPKTWNRDGRNPGYYKGSRRTDGSL